MSEWLIEREIECMKKKCWRDGDQLSIVCYGRKTTHQIYWKDGVCPKKIIGELKSGCNRERKKKKSKILFLI